jgi:hypothetical protein
MLREVAAAVGLWVSRGTGYSLRHRRRHALSEPRCCWASLASDTILADTFPAMTGSGGAGGGQRPAGADGGCGG